MAMNPPFSHSTSRFLMGFHGFPTSIHLLYEAFFHVGFSDTIPCLNIKFCAAYRGQLLREILGLMQQVWDDDLAVADVPHRKDPEAGLRVAQSTLIP